MQQTPPEVIVGFVTLAVVSLYAVLVHWAEPWYQRKRLTIFSVMIGVAIVGGMAELLFGVLYQLPEWSFYRNRIILLFALSAIPMGIQQFIRWHQLHRQRERLAWDYFTVARGADYDEAA
jgi:MFS family permease